MAQPAGRLPRLVRAYRMAGSSRRNVRDRRTRRRTRPAGRVRAEASRRSRRIGRRPYARDWTLDADPAARGSASRRAVGHCRFEERAKPAEAEILSASRKGLGGSQTCGDLLQTLPRAALGRLSPDPKDNATVVDDREADRRAARRHNGVTHLEALAHRPLHLVSLCHIHPATTPGPSSRMTGEAASPPSCSVNGTGPAMEEAGPVLWGTIRRYWSADSAGSMPRSPFVVTNHLPTANDAA